VLIVAVAEGDVRMRKVYVVVRFGFWDSGCGCASIEEFGGAVLVAVAYGECV